MPPKKRRRHLRRASDLGVRRRSQSEPRDSAAVARATSVADASDDARSPPANDGDTPRSVSSSGSVAHSLASQRDDGTQSVYAGSQPASARARGGALILLFFFVFFFLFFFFFFFQFDRCANGFFVLTRVRAEMELDDVEVDVAESFGLMRRLQLSRARRQLLESMLASEDDEDDDSDDTERSAAGERIRARARDETEDDDGAGAVSSGFARLGDGGDDNEIAADAGAESEAVYASLMASIERDEEASRQRQRELRQAARDARAADPDADVDDRLIGDDDDADADTDDNDADDADDVDDDANASLSMASADPPPSRRDAREPLELPPPRSCSRCGALF